ncbi:MAG: MMPL family transporter [Salinarimonas sp.]|nr:MMPL family transporter [Salinarimonas sp.]
MKKIISAWSAGICRFRWLIIVLTPILVVLASAPSQNIYFAHSPDMWFVDDDPINQDFKRLNAKFGDTQNLLVGVSSASDESVIAAEPLEALRDIHEFLLTRAEVVDVQSLINYQYIRAEDDILTIEDLVDRDAPPFGLIPDSATAETVERTLSGEPIAVGDLVTQDMRHTALIAELHLVEGGRVDHHLALIDALDEFLEIQAYDDKGIAVTVFGRPYISHALASGTIEDQILFYPLLLVLVTVLNLLVFRDFRSVVGPIMVIFSAVMVVFSIQGLMHWPTTAANGLMPFLIIIICVGICAHFMMAFYRYLGTGMTSFEAVEGTLLSLARPASFAALTTIFGFIALTVTALEPLRQYGILAMIGVASCLFFCFLLLPAILATAKKAPSWARAAGGDEEAAGETVLTRMTGLSARNPVTVTAIAALVFIGSIGATLSLKLDTNFVSMFKPESEFRQNFDYFDEVFRGGQAIEIMLDSGRENGVFNPDFLADADALETSLAGYDGTGKPRSALQYIKQMNVALNNGNEDYRRIPDSAEASAQMLLLYENAGPERSLGDQISVDQRFMRISVGAQNMSASETQALVNRMEADFAENWPALDVMLTGDLVLYNRLETLIAQGMVISFGLALGTIMLALVLLFRDMRMTLLATVASVLPIFIGGAVMKAMGIYPDINALIVASVTIGLAVDDSIHYLVRYERGRRAGMSVDRALNQATRKVGSALLLSTVILVGGFSIFFFASMQSGVNFGLLSVIIITSAFLADILVLPALVKIVDRRDMRVTEAMPTSRAVASPA